MPHMGLERRIRQAAADHEPARPPLELAVLAAGALAMAGPDGGARAATPKGVDPLAEA